MKEENIYNFLLETTDSDEKTSLVDVVNKNSIGWVDINVNSSYPRVVFNIMSNPELYQTDDKWQRWRFYIEAHDKWQVRNIADIITDKLNNAYGLIDGVYFDKIVRLDESPLSKRDDGIYEMYIDFRVLYH